MNNIFKQIMCLFGCRFCPACGSRDLSSREQTAYIPITHGEPAKWKETIYCCKSCGIEADFDAHKLDPQRRKIINAAKIKSAIGSLEFLKERGISDIDIARSFRMMEVVRLWRAGIFSSGDLALINIVRSIPEIVDFADNDYENGFSVAAFNICPPDEGTK